MSHYHAIVIGAGHNGLTTAALLARAGQRVLVVEQCDQIGGTATTAEFHPGFQADWVHHDAGTVRNALLDDLNLKLNLHHPDPIVFAPHLDGSSLTLWEDEQQTVAAIGRISPADAANYPAFRQQIQTWAAYLEKQLAQSADMALLADPEMLLLLRQCSMSVEQFLSQWFTHPFVQGVLAAPGITGIRQGPYSGGTTYVLLHHLLGQQRAGTVATAQVIGGIGRLPAALARVATEHGAEIRVNAPVAQIIVAKNQATGVVLQDGTRITADCIISSADPKATFLKLVDPFDLPPRFKKAVRNIKMRGAVARMHLALSDLPEFTALPDGDTRFLQGRIQISPSLVYLERAYDAAKYGDFSAEPYLDIRIPTLADPTLAPSGQHVMSIWMQYAPYALRNGSWPTRADELGAAILRTIEQYAPGIRDLIIAQHLLTPNALESEFGLTEGAIYQGELMLDQLLYMRPVPGWANYATPIDNLFLCGAAAHPGGGITGEPGRLAAAHILAQA